MNIQNFVFNFFIFLIGCTPIKKNKFFEYEKEYVSSKVIPKKEKHSNRIQTYIFGKHKTLKTHVGYIEEGIASWYGKNMADLLLRESI